MKRLRYVTDEPWTVSTAGAIRVDRVCRGLAAPGWGLEVVQPGSAPRDDAWPYARVRLRLPGFLGAVTFQLAVIPPLIQTFLSRGPAALYVRQGTCVVISCQGSGRLGGTGSAENLVTSL